MIDIAMVSCNRGRITASAIQEIRARTTTPYRLLVLDNGSEDDSVRILQAHYDKGYIDVLVLLKENTGIHWAHNMLLDMVESERYVCTDNDLVPCVPTEEGDWLSRLIDLAERNPNYGAIACRPHILIGEGGGLFKDSPEIKDRGHVGAHLRIMPTAAVRKSGGWKREKRPARNHEEKTICGKLRKRDLKVGYSRDIRCIHLWGKEEEGEDDWGYPAHHDHKARGHRDIWPPVDAFAWYKRGVDWETCRREGESENG